jgi:hypothetical protein
MNDKVKLELIKTGVVKEYDFDHALAIMRIDKHNDFKVVGNHEFINNELIIKPSTRGSKESTEPIKGTKGRKVRKSSKDSNTSL